MRRRGGAMNGFWQTLRREFDGQQRLAALLVNLVWALIAVCIISLIARVLRNVVRRGMARARVPHNVVQLASNGVTLVSVIVMIAVLLSIFGVPSTAVVTAFSLATAGIALSFQEVLKNLIAGIYLLVEHPFTVGDYVRVRDVEGAVEAVNVRTTALRTNEGVIVMVPNNIIFTDIVQNRTVSGVRHSALTLANLAGDPDAISEQALTALKPLQLLSVPAPQTQLLGVKDGTAEIQVEFWYDNAYPDLNRRAIAALRMAFPDASISSTKAA